MITLKRCLTRMWRGWLVALMLCAAMGCSNLDLSRSPASALGDKLRTSDMVPATDGDPSDRDLDGISAALVSWQEQALAVDDDYDVGAGDVLRLEILSLETPGKTSVLTRAIDKDGMIGLPLLGRIEIAGEPLRALEQRVQELYRDGYILEPEVAIQVEEYRSAPVLVTGAVSRPGVYYLQRTRGTLLELLFEAGGLSAAAGQEARILRGRFVRTMEAAYGGDDTGEMLAPDGDAARVDEAVEAQDAALDSYMDLERYVADAEPGDVLGENEVRINLAHLIDEGDIRQNALVRKGDVIIVAPKDTITVYVFGYVPRPGPLMLETQEDRSILNVFAKVGGPSGQGSPDKCLLVRPDASGRKQAVKVDMTGIARGVRPDIYMEDGDTLLVGAGFLQKLTEIIRPTFSAGASATTAVVP